MRHRPALTAVLTAAAVVSTTTACSFSVGDAHERVELQSVAAEHIVAQVPADWESVGDADGWSYVHQLEGDGGVRGRIGFMPGGEEMTAEEAVDWFVGQVESGGSTNGDFAADSSLRTGEDRANTTYTYESGGETYRAVVWGLTDGAGIPSLVQLSGADDVVTDDLVAQVDGSLELTGDWQG